jgi:hypothetical protein
MKIEEKTTISGRRDGMSRSSQLYFVRNVKIHCVIALTFRLRPTRANEKKIVFHFPPRVYARWSIFSPFCAVKEGERKRNCIAAISLPSRIHPRDINQATTFDFIHLWRVFGDAASVGIIEPSFSVFAIIDMPPHCQTCVSVVSFRENSSQVHSHFGVMEVGRGRERRRIVVCRNIESALFLASSDRFTVDAQQRWLREERHDKNVAIFTFSQQMP